MPVNFFIIADGCRNSWIRLAAPISLFSLLGRNSGLQRQIGPLEVKLDQTGTLPKPGFNLLI